MADEKRLNDESKIAVLSVLKKGSILKHIFLNLPLQPARTSAAGGNARQPSRSVPSRRKGGKKQRRCMMTKTVRSSSVGTLIVMSFWIAPASAASTSPFASFPRSRSYPSPISRPFMGHGFREQGLRPNVSVDMMNGDSLRLGASTRIYRLQWLSMSRAMEMENPLETVVEDKEETCQDDRGDVVAGGRDKLPNVIPSARLLPEILSSSPLPTGMQQQSPERKETEVEKSNFLSDVPTEILNSSPLRQ